MDKILIFAGKISFSVPMQTDRMDINKYVFRRYRQQFSKHLYIHLNASFHSGRVNIKTIQAEVKSDSHGAFNAVRAFI